MLVFDELRSDLVKYGSCSYSITDTDDEFAIERLDPMKFYDTVIITERLDIL